MKKILSQSKGAVLLSSLLFLVIVTVVAAGALMFSTVQMKVSYGVARWESALSAAEGGINYVIPLVQNIHYTNKIPTTYSSIVVDPALVTELSDASKWNDKDTDGGDVFIPSTSAKTINAMDVKIDIDAIGSVVIAGSDIQFDYRTQTAGGGGGRDDQGGISRSGGGASGAMLKGYMISSSASTPAGTTRARMQQVLWLRF
ncbi:MAG: hypothetical protein M0042_04165 [Nitrospiraceae bacterium]|nr:hypothetical protein [Nitrospiraceae bacterium]